MLDLPNVTLLSVSSVEIEATHAALAYCASLGRFGAVKMLTPAPPSALAPGIEHVAITPLDLAAYSRFMLGELHAHVATAFCLVVQPDGFIVDPGRWEPGFLACDYIGAPWPDSVATTLGGRLRLDRNRVGNGGFSLRSKRLLEITAGLDFRAEMERFRTPSEDLLICHFLFDRMQAAGVRFAPLEVARRFAIETPEPGRSLNTVFGFHGRIWLDQVRRRRARLDQATRP